MNILRQRLARFGIGLGLATTMALSAVVPALAADPGLEITGTPVSATAGALSYSIDGGTYDTANSIALNGLTHTLAIKVPITLTDYSGDDLGWKVNLSLTKFTTSESVALGEGDLGVTKAASAACDTLGSKHCSNEDGAVTNGVGTLASYTNDGTDVKIFASDSGTHAAGVGMGQYTFDTIFTVTLPTTAKKGTYSSTLVVTGQSAP